MTSVFIAVFLMSATSILFFLCLLLLRPVTKKRLSATWHYRMYVLAIMFLIVPIGAIFGGLLTYTQNATSQELPSVPTLINEIIAIPQTDLQLVVPTTIFRVILTFLPYIWLLGVFIFLIWHDIQLIRFKRKIIKTSLQIEDISILSSLEHSMTEMGVRGKLQLFSNNFVKTPMLVGLFRTYLILPEVEITDRELALILKHELIHFKRRDLWVKSFALAANAIHWFNPLAYLLTKNIGIFCELSCDEQVVSDISMENRRFYGETILNVLCRVVNQHSGVYATLAESKKGIERRLTHMMDVKKSSKKTVVLSLALMVILITAGIGTAAIINANNRDSTAYIYEEKETLVMQSTNWQKRNNITVFFESTSGPLEIILTLYVKSPGENEYTPIQNSEILKLGDTIEFPLQNKDCQYEVYAVMTEGTNGNILLRWNK